LLGAMSGPAVARRTSFLLGHEEEAVFAEQIRIIDDPHRCGGCAPGRSTAKVWRPGRGRWSRRGG
jgi:hypothetical protein